MGGKLIDSYQNMTILYGIVVGLIASLPWGSAFGVPVSQSLIGGLIAGALFGSLGSLFGKAARVGGNVTQGEALFVNTSLMTLLGMIIIGLGVAVWIISYFIS